MVYRIDDTTAVAILPALPTDNIGSPGFFTGGSTGGQSATRVRYWWLNMVQEELFGIPASVGIAPDKTNNGQVLAAIKMLISTALTSYASVSDLSAEAAARANADALLQPLLGYIPTQQGGGFNQVAGKVYLGRDTTYPGLRYSYLAPDGETVTGGGYLISSYGPESGGAAGYGQIGDISTDPNGRMAWRLPALGATYITGALYSDVTAETIRATNAEAQLLPLQNTGAGNVYYGGPSLPYCLALQTDGNLVVYYEGNSIFSVTNGLIRLGAPTYVGEATDPSNIVPLSQANSLVSAEAVARADADATLVSGTIGVNAANSDTNGVSLYRNGGSGRPTFVYSSGTGTLAGDIAWAGDLPFSDSSLKMQAFSVTVVDGASVAFPTAFSERPYLFLTPQHNPESDPNKASNIANYYQDTLTASGFVMDLRALWTGGTTNGETNAIEVMVLAIGTMG